MGLDSYLPLKNSGQSVIHRNLPYRFLRGQPLNYYELTMMTLKGETFAGFKIQR